MLKSFVMDCKKGLSLKCKCVYVTTCNKFLSNLKVAGPITDKNTPLFFAAPSIPLARKNCVKRSTYGDHSSLDASNSSIFPKVAIIISKGKSTLLPKCDISINDYRFERLLKQHGTHTVYNNRTKGSPHACVQSPVLLYLVQWLLAIYYIPHMTFIELRHLFYYYLHTYTIYNLHSTWFLDGRISILVFLAVT